MDIIILLLKQNLVMFVYLIIGYFLYKKKLVSTQGSADIGRILLYIVMPVAILKSYLAAFSNAGFIGISLVQMTLGEEAVFYVSSFVALLNILQWTYGLVTITRDKSLVSMKRLRTNRNSSIGIFLSI